MVKDSQWQMLFAAISAADYFVALNKVLGRNMRRVRRLVEFLPVIISTAFQSFCD